MEMQEILNTKISRICSIMQCSLLKVKACCYLYAGIIIGSLLNPEDGDDMYLRNVGWLSTEYTALRPTR
jgi:hypothetical protein